MSTQKAFLAAREEKPNRPQLDAPIELVIGGVPQKPVERDLIANDPNPDLSKLRLSARSQEGAILAGDTELTADEVREAIARMTE
jgi:hypothetical protein